MKLKRFILLLALVTLLGALAACEAIQQPSAAQDAADNGKPRVIATIFPQYDFLRAIGGDKINLSMLLAPGAESHSFEPTPKDMIAISEADLFVYVGGHADEWVDDLLKTRGDGKQSLALVDMVETVPEEIIEGMEHDHDHDHADADEAHDHDHDHEEAEEAHDHDHDHEDEHGEEAHDHDHDHDHEHGEEAHDHDHEHGEEAHDHDHEHGEEAHDHDHDHDHEHGEEAHDHDHDHDHEHGEEAHDHDHDHDHEHEHAHDHSLDEHVWTDPQNAIKIVRQLADALAKIDPENADFYNTNAENYIAKLDALDQEFAELVANAPRKTIVVGDRFPLRYFVDRYGLTYYAAFPGCSTEGDASPQTVAYLVDKVEDEKIPVVFHIELSNQQIAKSIAEATGAEVLEFHSLHNISPEDFKAGKTYLELMEQNLENLKKALSE